MQHGKLVALLGTARRAIRVQVDDADIRTRFKIDHYFEIEMFTEDSQNNPITVCVRRLPRGMPLGDNIRETVRIPAFFFKMWSYRAGPSASQKDKGVNPDNVRWPAPLFIGREPIWIRPEDLRDDNPWFGVIGGTMFIMALGLVWMGVWSFNRSDDRFHRRNIGIHRELSGDVSLNSLGLEVGPEINFLNYGESSATSAEATANSSAAESDSTETASGTIVIPSRPRYYVKEVGTGMGISGGLFRALKGTESGEKAPRKINLAKDAEEKENIFAETIRRSKQRPSPLQILWPLLILALLIFGLLMLGSLATTGQ